MVCFLTSVQATMTFPYFRFFAVALFLCERNTLAFAPTSLGDSTRRALTSTAFQRPKFIPITILPMAGEGSDVNIQTKSGKGLSYDSKSGRFYEADSELGPDEPCNPNDEYCTIDDKSGERIRLTIEEKERIFLDALQSYYASGRQLLSDSDFDLLKEDLQWNGSEMVAMNRKEVTFLSAIQAYTKGEPIISDEEYNKLKAELKEEGSKFAVSREPVCYIDTGVCKATFEIDNFRTNLLYLPLGVTLTLAWLVIVYEIFRPLVHLNPLLLLALGSVPIYKLTKKLMEDIVFQNFKIAYGPCPACGAENRIYFGDILGVEGFKKIADLKCVNCKTDFKVQAETLRASTLPKP